MRNCLILGAIALFISVARGQNPAIRSCTFERGDPCDLTGGPSGVAQEFARNSTTMLPWFDHTIGNKQGSFAYMTPGARRTTFRTRMSGVQGSVCLSFWYTTCPDHTIQVFRRYNGQRDGILQLAQTTMNDVWRRATVTFTASSSTTYELELEMSYMGNQPMARCVPAIDDFSLSQGACGMEPELSVRLSGGASAEEGRVEVMWRGRWGSVCADSFGWNEAATVCRHFGFSQGRTKLLPSYGYGPSQVWLDGLKCPDYGASSLAECKHHGFGMVGCRPNEYASVRCNVPEVSSQSAKHLRLANIQVVRDGVIEGRVEVKVNNKWGGVCSLDQQAAQAVCSNFGYDGQATILGGSARGRGNNAPLLDRVTCDSNEKDFWNCKKEGATSGGCSNPDVAVRCTYNIQNFPYSCTITGSTSCNLFQAPYSDRTWSFRRDFNSPDMMVCNSGNSRMGICSMVAEKIDSPPGSGYKCLRYSYTISDRSAGDLKVYIQSRGRKPQLLRWTARDTSGHGVSGSYSTQVDFQADTFKVIFKGTMAPSYSGFVGISSFSVAKGLCSGAAPPTQPPRTVPPRTPSPRTQPPTPSTPTRRVVTTAAPIDPDSGKVVYECNFDNDECLDRTDYSGPSKSDGRFLWLRRQGNTPSGGTGPSKDNSGNGYYMFIESSSPATPGMIAKLQTKAVFSPGTYCLRLSYHMMGSGMGSINVRFAGTSIWRKSGDQGSDWHSEELSFPAQSSGSLTIEGIRGSSWQGDAALDDVKLSTGACAAERNPCSPNPCSGNDVCEVNGDSFRCLSGSGSVDSVRCSFNNRADLCETGSVENGTQATDGNQQMWYFRRGRTPSDGTGPNADRSGNGGYVYLEVSGVSSGRFCRMKTPLLRGNRFCVSFWTHMYGRHVNRLEVMASADNGPYSTVETIQNQPRTNGVDRWEQRRVTVSLPSASSVRIALDAYSGGGYQGDIAVDDLDITGGSC